MTTVMYRVVILRRGQHGFYADSFEDSLFSNRGLAIKTAVELAKESREKYFRIHLDTDRSEIVCRFDSVKGEFKITRPDKRGDYDLFIAQVHEITHKTTAFRINYRGYRIDYNPEANAFDIYDTHEGVIISRKRDFNGSLLLIDNIFTTGTPRFDIPVALV